MKKFLLSFALIMTFGLGAMAQNAAEVTENPNAPVITFDITDHDYGTIYQNADGNCVFVYTNDGKEPLILSRVKSSCGCTIPKWSRQPLMPGQSDTIKVKYDTKRLGSFHKSITITSNAKTPTVVLKIKGKVLAQPDTAMPTKNVDKDMSPVNK
ncbi:DUF1573 domain-containing protein [Lentimicrobium sp. L6]|uniref:DUF1573 domain-containing protein n=1 Tax=Lentimicrobium sp. L6 TaxID=2735916 RepID=UPI001552A39E|nr:DUF1573 domain-containing protein [Lentimicrobium sp. L6]NPD86371.1 DUF1573 domain-containing protein [Lentimicrobium sp. L6]